MSVMEQARPTVGASSEPTLRERAKALAPAIAERAAQAERDRKAHDDSIAEMRQAGLFRALQAKRFGGEEASPEDFYGAVLEISKACPSTGWVLGILGVHPWEFAQMTLEVQEEVFGDNPDTLVSSSYAPQGTAVEVDGGYRLNGEWRSSSGIPHATWSVVGAVVHRDGEVPNLRSFLLPLNDPSIKIVDDWYTMGLAATGSRRIVLDDVFVPKYRSIDRDMLRANAGPGLKVNTSPLYRLPQMTVYIGPGSAPAIGAAYGFLEEFKRQSAARVRRNDGTNLGQDRIVELRVAEGGAKLRAMENTLLTAYRQMYEIVCSGRDLTPEEGAIFTYDLSRAAMNVTDVAYDLMPLLQAGVVYQSNPLQRYYRDLLTMRQHGTQDVTLTMTGAAAAEYGRPIMGPGGVTTEILAAVRERAARGEY